MFANKKTLVLIISLTLLIVILLVANFTRTKPQPTLEPSLPPITKFTPRDLNTVPMASDQSVDLNSSAIQESKLEIDKIKPKLPFRENFTANSGTAVEIFIPKIGPDESEWALTIQVTGIDYQIPTSEEQNAKQAFLQASNRIFDWLILQGINPNKLYIVWADKKYARDKIDSWLKSQ